MLIMPSDPSVLRGFRFGVSLTLSRGSVLFKDFDGID